MSRFSILLGGDVSPTPRLLRQLDGTRVIAADAGMAHAGPLGLVPELWVGDFDSVPDTLSDRLAAVPRRAFPFEKDKTDGELAIEAALEQGATSLLLVGAFGGRRSDHEFLHLAIAMRLAAASLAVVLTSGPQEGHPLHHGSQFFDYGDGTLFSILGFTALSGLTITGAKWPLDAVRVEFGSSLTISNETRGRLAITLGDGQAMLIAHPRQEA